MRRLLPVLCLLAGPALAQSFGVTEDDADVLPDMSDEITTGIVVETLELGTQEEISLSPRNTVTEIAVTGTNGALLKGLDKVTGEVVEMEMAVGDTAELGRLTVKLSDCRFPTDNPAGDAFALLTITADEVSEPMFEGWMMASSPALNALEHPRYDVWVIRCRTV